MEARFYDALVAQATCAAGRFVLYGLPLKPFSLLHSVQLDALESALWIGGEIEESDLMIGAIICSRDTPAIDFKMGNLAAPMLFAAALAVWRSYMELCCAHPDLKDRAGDDVGGTLKAPMELLMVTYLARKLHVPLAEAWAMPRGLAHWYFESGQEQEEGASWILTEEEKAEEEEMLSPEGIAAREKMDTQARRISEIVTDPAKRIELLGQAALGTLPDDWEAHIDG